MLTPPCAALERCAEVLQREYGVNLRPQLGQRSELRAVRLHHEILGARGFRCDPDYAPARSALRASAFPPAVSKSTSQAWPSRTTAPPSARTSWTATCPTPPRARHHPFAARLNPAGELIGRDRRQPVDRPRQLITGDRGRLDADKHLARTRLGPHDLLQHESLRVQP